MSKYYTETHEWIEKTKGNVCEVGLTDYALKQLGDVVYLELRDKNEQVNENESFGVIESVKAASDIYSPIYGKIVEVNEFLIDNVDSITSDDWLIKVESDGDVSGLMDEDQYIVFCHE